MSDLYHADSQILITVDQIFLYWFTYVSQIEETEAVNAEIGQLGIIVYVFIMPVIQG